MTALLCLVGCRSPATAPPPFQPERREIQCRYRLRDPARVPAEAAGFGTLRATILGLESWPEEFGELVATRARLIGSYVVDDYLRPSQRLGADSRIGTLEDAGTVPGSGRNQVLSSVDAVWAPGVQTCFRDGTPSVDAAGLDQLELRVSPDRDGEVRLVLSLEGLADVTDAEDLVQDDPSGEPVPREPQRVEESIHFALPEGGGSPCFVIRRAVPADASVPDGVGAQAVAVVLEIGMPPNDLDVDAQHETAVEFCRRALEEEARPAGPSSPTLNGLLGGIDEPEPLRLRLAFLGRDLGAYVAEDLALSAPPDALRELCAALAGDEFPEDLDPGHHLQVACLKWLAGRVADGAAEPELEAVLLNHTGEMARNPLVLIEALDFTTDLEDLERRLVRGNRLMLGDSLTSARLRAFDWLDQRGLRPSGYDPLAPRDERRAVLRTLEAEWSETVEEPPR